MPALMMLRFYSHKDFAYRLLGEDGEEEEEEEEEEGAQKRGLDRRRSRRAKEKDSSLKSCI